MSAPTNASIVLGFPEYRQPARRLAERAGLAYADIGVHRFPDGESLVRLPESVPEQLILYSSLDEANRRLIELELAAVTAQRLGAKRLSLVAPYLCYMRQDKAFRPGEAISQRVIGDLLARRFDTLITVDPHLHRTHRLRDAVPVRRAVAVSAAPAIAAWLGGHTARHHRNPLLIGPDAESAQWLSAIAAPAKLEYAVARKQRLGDREVRIHLPELVCAGRQIVLVDDVASTGQTLAETARQVAGRQAESITVLVSHALFVGDALQRLMAAGVEAVYSTDSIPHPSNRVQLDGLLVEALLGN